MSLNADEPPTKPTAVIALLLYNHAEQLPETLDSLQQQELRDFAVLLVDDGSTDATQEICETVASKDPRFIYLRDGIRRGYIGNARYAFAEAVQRFPKAPYFAWGSDHDLYHPRWLGQLVAALETNPDASLAWPYCYRMDGAGRILERVVHRFETSGISDPLVRFRTTLRASLTGETVVGNMIYGLFRREALAYGPGLRYLLLPDRVAILEAALTGTCMQVPEALWYRRYEGIASHSRQRRTSFFKGPPWYLIFPVWLTHAGHFLANWGLRGQGGAAVTRGQGFAAGFLFLLGYPRWHVAHRLRMRLPQWRRRFAFTWIKPVQMELHRANKRMRGILHGALRRLGMT